MSFLDKLFSTNSSAADMTDRELERKLKQSTGKNTGEDIATRAAYILEAERRGISTNQKEE